RRCGRSGPAWGFPGASSPPEPRCRRPTGGPVLRGDVTFRNALFRNDTPSRGKGCAARGDAPGVWLACRASFPLVATLVECSREARRGGGRPLRAEGLGPPRRFWLREAGLLDWVRPPEEAFAGDMLRGDLSWFAGGLLSPAWNAVDRHASVSPERTALLWARAEGDLVAWSFRRLRQESARMAQVLLAQGVRWGDRVVAYLPETPTLAMLHLGCARIGAVPPALPVTAPALRARALWNGDGAPALGVPLTLWGRVEEAVGGLGRVESVLVERRAGAEASLVYGRDHGLGVALLRARPTCAVRPCDADYTQPATT